MVGNQEVGLSRGEKNPHYTNYRAALV